MTDSPMREREMKALSENQEPQVIKDSGTYCYGYIRSIDMVTRGRSVKYVFSEDLVSGIDKGFSKYVKLTIQEVDQKPKIQPFNDPIFLIQYAIPIILTVFIIILIWRK